MSGPGGVFHNSAMRVHPVIAVLLFSMLLQAVSLGGRWAGRDDPVDALHTVLHWTGTLHHHDHEITKAEIAAGGKRARIALEAKQWTTAIPDDAEGFEAFAEEFAMATVHIGEAYHQDESLDSRHHLSLDTCLASVGLLPTMPRSTLLPPVAVAPAAPPQSQRADPFLDGPRRPPRPLA